MVRILLPLAVIAALLFAPIMGVDAKLGGIEKDAPFFGYDYVANTIDCWRSGDFSLKGDCKPQEGLMGQAIFAALFASAVAAGLGVLGLLPFIGRITSLVTTVAGAVVIAAIGYVAFTQLSGDDGDALRWGTYLAGGGGLLTLISGLSGMRGR